MMLGRRALPSLAGFRDFEFDLPTYQLAPNAVGRDTEAAILGLVLLLTA
jgi:hypothetical protein